MLVTVYRRVDNSELFRNVSQCPIEIPNGKTKEVCTLFKSIGYGICVEFNFQHQPTGDQIV